VGKPSPRGEGLPDWDLRDKLGKLGEALCVQGKGPPMSSAKKEEDGKRDPPLGVPSP